MEVDQRRLNILSNLSQSIYFIYLQLWFPAKKGFLVAFNYLNRDESTAMR